MVDIVKMGAAVLDKFVFCAVCVLAQACWSDAASISARFLEVPLGVSSTHDPKHFASSNLSNGGGILVQDGGDAHEVPSWFVTGFVFVVVALFLILLLIAACVCLRERKEDSAALRRCQGQGSQSSRVHTLSETQPPPTYTELFGTEQEPPAYDSLYPQVEVVPKVEEEVDPKSVKGEVVLHI